MLTILGTIVKYVLAFFLARTVSYYFMIIVVAAMEIEITSPVAWFLTIVPFLIGALAAYGIYKFTAKPKEDKDKSDRPVDAEAEINTLMDKEDSVFTVIKEEIACWNWQLVVGGLIFCMGFFNLLSNFFFAIVLIVLGLGILSIGITKYKEKQELQERELKRKIMAAVAKEAPCEEKTEPAPIPKPADKKQTVRTNTECKTYKLAGVTHYAENIRSLGIENEDYFKSKRELIAEDMIDERIWKYEFYPGRVLLLPEADNPVDPNAIKVIVDGEHVGYIKSGSTSHVHKLIANHAIEHIGCTIGGGPYKCVSEEYDDEKDEDVYVLESDEVNFFVHLEIYEKVNVSNAVTKEPPSEDTTVSTPVPKQSTEKQTKSANTTSKTEYVLVPATMTIHRKNCRYAVRTYSSNKGYTDSRLAAINIGYKPCKYCKP